MFEEIFEESEHNEIKSEPQRAALRLLERLEKSNFIETMSDGELIKAYVKRKFA